MHVVDLYLPWLGKRKRKTCCLCGLGLLGGEPHTHAHAAICCPPRPVLLLAFGLRIKQVPPLASRPEYTKGARPSWNVGERSPRAAARPVVLRRNMLLLRRDAMRGDPAALDASSSPACVVLLFSHEARWPVGLGRRKPVRTGGLTTYWRSFPWRRGRQYEFIHSDMT